MGKSQAGALLTLAVLTLMVIVAYAARVQGPIDALDRLVLAVRPSAYAPRVRAAQRDLRLGRRASLMGEAARADSLLWAAASEFARAGEEAADPERAETANDRAAGLYLELGRRALEEGRGRWLGIGRRSEALGASERAAVCAAALAPTHLRSAINAFLEDVEATLGRAPGGGCPR